MATISRNEFCEYKASPKFEKQFAEIRDFVSNQTPPEGLLEQANFLQDLFDFLENTFGKKEISQGNFTLSIVDLLRNGSCSINDNLYELDQPYLENEDYYFNWEWKDFVDPIIQLSQEDNHYKAFLLLSIYANLATPYGAAYGYDGSDEGTKIEFLEYLISINSSDPVKLKKDLEKKYIPQSSPHFQLDDSEIKQVGVSQDAVVVYNLKNDLISRLNDLNLEQFVYGIILGKIHKDAVIKYMPDIKRFESAEIDDLIFNLDNLLQGPEEEDLQNNLIFSDVVHQSFEDLSSFAKSQAANTLIEFLMQLTKLVSNLESIEPDCAGLHGILEALISFNTDNEPQAKYIEYLTEIGGEFKENTETAKVSINKKKGLFSKFLGR
jgi:hypothetical protein